MRAGLEFDGYLIDAESRRLLHRGKSVPLNAKAFDLLLLLVSAGGALISREAIYERLWPQGTVEDSNLSQNIHVLRRALDPRGDGRSFIETVPRFGYRFAKPVRTVEPAQMQTTPMPALRWALLALFAGVLTLLAFFGPTGKTPISASAREAYALGIYHLSLRSEPELHYALQYFRQTVRGAPGSAIGYASVASAYALLAQFQPDGSAAQRREVALAEASRNEALQREPGSADALAVSGLIDFRFENNPAVALSELRRAVSIDRGNALAHHWLGELLLTNGDVPGAIAELRIAHTLEPTSEVIARWLARAYTYDRRPGDAIPLALQALQIQPNDASAYLVLACAQEQRGQLEASLRTLRALAQRLPSEKPYALADEARIEYLLARPSGRPAIVSRVDRLVAARQADAFEAALFYLTANEHERAAQLLQLERDSPWLVALQRFDPRFEKLR